MTTKKQIVRKVEQLVEQELELMQSQAPIDTGWLSSSIQLVKIDKDTYKIEVPYDVVVDERGSHYLPYTNEEWISPKWGGKHNPNKNWWNKAREQAIQNIVMGLSEKFGGSLKDITPNGKEE